ncbi:MAG TPA: MliC family protein [Salinisphaeraceae bacterium]|nr:MliC family protein [Salinisphaeraceae bacterium]
MRTSFIVLSALFLAGCAGQTATNNNTAAFSATYECNNGEQIQVHYLPPDEATITLDERSIDMHIAVSGSGARYVGDGLEWWTKGSGPGSSATLFAHDPATGASGERITRCTESG